MERNGSGVKDQKRKQEKSASQPMAGRQLIDFSLNCYSCSF